MRKLGVWALRALGVLVLIIGILAFAGLVWYLSDGTIAADVVHKECHTFGSSAVTIETRMFGIERTRDLAFVECETIPDGAYVEYYIRSGRTIIFETQGGECVWDTGGIGPC